MILEDQYGSGGETDWKEDRQRDHQGAVVVGFMCQPR